MSLFLRPQAQPVTAAVQPAQLRRATAAPYNAKRAITASAAPVRVGGLQQQRPYAEWQRYAWTGYEKVGEIHYGLDQLAKLLSRIRIFAGAVVDSGDAPVVAHEAAADNHIDSALAADATKAIEDLVAGDFSSMLRSFTLNMSVVGECHLVRMPDAPARTVDPLAGGPTPEPTFTWVIRSTDEVQVKPTGVGLVPMRGATSETRQLPADTYIARVWRSSARYSSEPDSSLVGIGEAIEELLLLSRVTRSGARSRLNAGMVFVPDSIVIANATKSDAAGDGVADAGGQFLEDLMDAMVTPITDEGSAAGVVPMLVSGPATEGEKIRHITFERKADEKNNADKERALERILQGLDIPKEIVTGLANVKYATLTNHQMLTRSGWRFYNQVSLGDEILTLNHETGMSEWCPLLEMNVHDVAPGERLLHMDSRNHHSVTTAEHRWPTVKMGKKVAGSRRRWTSSGEGFTSTDRVDMAVPYAQAPIDAKYTDDFVRLVALYTSDSAPPSAPERGSRRWASIGKVKPNEITAVRAVLTRLFGPAQTGRAYGPAWAETTRVNTNRVSTHQVTQFRLNEDVIQELEAVAPGRDRIVQEQFVLALTSAQLELFLSSLLDIGDGVRVQDGVWRFWQMEKDRLLAIELAAVLSGRTARWVTPVEPGTSTGGIDHQGLYGLTVSSKVTQFQPYERHTKHEWVEPPAGTKVFCPTTRNQTWFAKYNGTSFYTGNTNAAIIDDNLYKANIEPLALMFVDAMTQVYLRPVLRGLTKPGTADPKYSEADLAKVVIWYDPSEIVTRPNASADATEGFNLGLLSGAAWRQAHGYSESDAPDEQELLRMLVTRATTTLPDDVLSTFLQKVFPETLGAARNANLAAQVVPFPQSAQNILSGEAPSAPAAPAEPAPAAAAGRRRA